MSIDYKAVYKIPAVRKALAEAEAEEAEAIVFEEWVDYTMGKEGEVVFELSTVIAADTVIKWHGKYYLMASDYEPEGPCDSIEAAMYGPPIGSIKYRDAEITSSELSLAEIRPLALWFSAKGAKVTIQGVDYRNEGEELVEI
jgi:hypothetical protein